MASNIEVASYDPKKVNLVMNGKIITGFASDSMITIARNEDTVTTQVGVKGDVACIVTDRTKKLIRILSWQFHFNPPIKEIFRPEIIAKDAAMVITPIPAILLYAPLCALNYKSKGLKKVKENAYLY